jgi:hypothetical protein
MAGFRFSRLREIAMRKTQAVGTFVALLMSIEARV